MHTSASTHLRCEYLTSHTRGFVSRSVVREVSVIVLFLTPASVIRGAGVLLSFVRRGIVRRIVHGLKSPAGEEERIRQRTRVEDRGLFLLASYH